MEQTAPSAAKANPAEAPADNWSLHEELSQRHAREEEKRRARGGWTIHEMVAIANAPRIKNHHRRPRRRIIRAPRRRPGRGVR